MSLKRCVSLKHHNSQTVRLRELKYLENVYLPPHITSQLSRLTCHVSQVMCHMSREEEEKRKKKWDKVVELVGGWSVINRPTPSSFIKSK